GNVREVEETESTRFGRELRAREARESGGDVGVVAAASEDGGGRRARQWGPVPPVGERMSRRPACAAGQMRPEVGQVGAAAGREILAGGGPTEGMTLATAREIKGERRAARAAHGFLRA
ncbi:hypothetical protein E2562_022267, partial [Oryza meyeriana var. granulata]